MKKTFTILSLLIAFIIHAQNWSPILPGEKMNYQHSDSAIITNTIWVRLTQIVNEDTIFRFNKVVKDVPDDPDIILRNQYQFFSSYIKKLDIGHYQFASPLNYHLHTTNNIGYSWNFGNSLTAEITNIIEEVILSIQDSVKIISLSDGNEIRLSKSFGIIKFPDFENGGYFELVGIQNTEFGESVPDFWDIFDFEVGDIQQRLYYHDYPNYSHEHITKTLFNSKEVFDDQITYDVYELTAGYNYYSGGGYVYFNDVFSGERNYTITYHDMANKFQDELILLEDYPYCSPNYDDDFLFARISIYPDENNLLTKHWGKSDFWSEGLYYETNSSSDILTALPPINCMSEGPHGTTYKESLGITAIFRADFETEDYNYLMGYIKDGIAVGEVYPDSYFITDIKSQSMGFENYLLYPNPAEDWLYIKPKESSKAYSYNIKLRNIFGQLVWEESNILSSHYAIHIADLKSGLYFYEIEEKPGISQKGKIIIK